MLAAQRDRVVVTIFERRRREMTDGSQVMCVTCRILTDAATEASHMR